MIRKDESSGRKISVKGKVLDYDIDNKKFLVEESSEQADKFITIRQNLVLLDFETKSDVDFRK